MLLKTAEAAAFSVATMDVIVVSSFNCCSSSLLFLAVVVVIPVLCGMYCTGTHPGLLVVGALDQHGVLRCVSEGLRDVVLEGRAAANVWLPNCHSRSQSPRLGDFSASCLKEVNCAPFSLQTSH